MVSLTLGELANALESEYLGDETLRIERVVHPAEATSASDLALVLEKSVIPLLMEKSISTALVPEEIPASQIPIPNQIRVRRPKVALAKLLDIFEKPPSVPPGIHPSAVIDPTAVIDPEAHIGPLCSVGSNTIIGKGTRLVSHVSVGADGVIGDDCTLFPGVYVGDRVRLGNRVIIQANASIGNDGYSYVTEEVGSVETARKTGKIEAQNAKIIRINSIGTVVLEDEVEIGANACVDRATLGETRIQRGTKIDNLVQVAHNVTIGQNCLITSQVGIAGSAKIGDRVVMGGQAGLKDHITIGEDVIIAPKTGVTDDVDPRTILIGFHGVPRKEFLKQEMYIKRIKSYAQRIEALEERLAKLESGTRPVEVESPV